MTDILTVDATIAHHEQSLETLTRRRDCVDQCNGANASDKAAGDRSARCSAKTCEGRVAAKPTFIQADTYRRADGRTCDRRYPTMLMVVVMTMVLIGERRRSCRSSQSGRSRKSNY